MDKSSTVIGVTPEDLGVILICAFRYALGRKSYMPGLVADQIRRYWDEIPGRDRFLISVELTRALRENEDPRFNRDLGWECDVETWRTLARDVVAE